MAIQPPNSNDPAGVKNYALLAGAIEANGGKLPATHFAAAFAAATVQELSQQETEDRSEAAVSSPQLSNFLGGMAADLDQMKGNITSSENNKVFGNSTLEDPYNDYESVAPYVV
jgi:hypothetical protein